MTIKAEVIADSINESGNRLTTWYLKYPRIIHSEFMTHRVFSRNSASSRAIPINKMMDNIWADPFIPERWGTNGAGMQDHGVLEESDQQYCQDRWIDALDEALYYAHLLKDKGVHKQVVNRLLEPWMHIEVIASATEVKNFFALRNHEAAEPHMQHLAREMWTTYNESKPVHRYPSWPSCVAAEMGAVSNGLNPDIWDKADFRSWHTPFVSQEHVCMCGRPGGLNCDYPTGGGCGIYNDYFYLPNMIKESVAHCAWVSYGKQFKQEYTKEDVNNVYNKLVGSQPIHASPTEHVAVACDGPHRHGNFTGWCQWRQFLPNENGGDYEA